MPPLLIAKDVSLEYPTKRVLRGVTVSVDDGSRIGIVGKNGGGKSSLLKLLVGEQAPDSGEVTKRSDATIGVLHQNDSLDPTQNAIDAVVGSGKGYEWAAERRTREIVEALLSDIDHESPINTLSGGQRRRVDLARVLIGSWDILMLDEPTNHLDMHTIQWLAAHLKSRWPQGTGALLVVTHDRWFLDEVCTTMWEVFDAALHPFDGGYSAYILQRVERERVAHVTQQKKQNLMRKELAWLSRGAQARSSKPKFHVKIARALIDDEPPPRNTLELKRAAMQRLGKRVVELVEVSESFGEKQVLDDITWLIGPGDRYAILGENGAGKTTLLRIITGELTPTRGHVTIGQTVKMAVLSQNLEELEALRDERVLDVLEQYKTGYLVEGKHLSPTQMLEQLEFEREYFQARIKDLSGGQKRRLQLLLTLLKEPNVLILDEPGNDFDTDMLAVMEDLLDTWPGTLILVSHDRYLVERVTDHQYALLDGRIRHMPGGIDEYLASINKRKEKEMGTPKSSQDRTFSARSKGQLKTGDPIGSGDAYEMRKQLASTERKMRTLEKQVEEAEQAMFNEDPSDFEALNKRQAALQELKDKMNELEDTWIELSETLEQS